MYTPRGCGARSRGDCEYDRVLNVDTPCQWVGRRCVARTDATPSEIRQWGKITRPAPCNRLRYADQCEARFADPEDPNRQFQPCAVRRTFRDGTVTCGTRPMSAADEDRWREMTGQQEGILARAARGVGQVLGLVQQPETAAPAPSPPASWTPPPITALASMTPEAVAAATGISVDRVMELRRYHAAREAGRRTSRRRTSSRRRSSKRRKSRRKTTSRRRRSSRRSRTRGHTTV